MKRCRFVFALFLDCAALVCNALATDILTSRGNNARTGLNANETVLTTSLVSSSSFGLVYNNPVDGQVYAQPLYVSNQLIIVNGQSQGTHNVLYVATEHDSLYAFDADSGVQYWKTSLLLSGESPVSSNDVNCTDLQPEIGITATPVIDRSAGTNGTIFVVAMSKNANNFFHRLHAVDLSTGQDRLTPAIISGSVTGTGPATTFVALQQRNRAGLLLLNNVIYTAWASFCDNPPYAGWIIGYNENDFSSTVALFNTDPNGPTNDPTDPLGGSGNGIWQSGNGPAIDSNNNIYVSTSNGPFDSLNQSGFPANGDFGDSVLKLTAIGGLAVSDFFTPSNQLSDRNNDIDLGSGGPMVLDIVDTSGITHNLLTQAGKDSNLYLLDRNNLGKFHSSDQIYQELDGVFPGGVWSSPAYFNGSIYLGGGPLSGPAGVPGPTGPLLQLQFDFTNPNKPLLKSTPASSTKTQFGFPGATPTISSNGTTNGIVWAYEQNNGQAILHAYDATNVGNELYNSNQNGIGGAVKFAVPTVCNGKVFVGTANSVAVFGLLPPGPQYVQGNYAASQTPQTTVTVPYTGPQTAGNLNVAIVGWNDTAARVSSVTDAQGNVYQLAVGPTLLSGALSQSVYYAKNIAAPTGRANAVTVTFDTAAIYPDIRILEYSEVDTFNPLDVVVGAQGNSATSSSGAVATTSANDLLVGANIVTGETTSAGSGFRQRLLTNPDGDIAEDDVVTATGSYSASAPLSSAGGWVMQMVAFRHK